MKTSSVVTQVLAALLLVLPARAAEPIVPVIENVAWQPLSAQIKRVLEAMDYQGSLASKCA